MNSMAMIERSARRQWAALSDYEQASVDQAIEQGDAAADFHYPIAWLWWVEVGARNNADYRLLPLMTVKEG